MPCPQLNETKRLIYADELARIANHIASDWRCKDILSRQFSWMLFEPSRRLVTQGWKIHVSAAAIEASEFLRIVPRIIVSHKVAFKLPSTVDGIVKLNSGAAGFSQIGKVLTAYPEDRERCEALVKALCKAWPKSAGPRIPSDLGFKADAPIFVRYGAFGGGPSGIDSSGRQFSFLETPKGLLVEDKRSVNGLQPQWVDSAPPSGARRDTANPLSTLTVGKLRVTPVLILHLTPKSSVQLAINDVDASTVILKRVKAGIGGDLDGFDGRDRLQNEYNMLTLLESEGFAYAPIGIEHNKRESILALNEIEGTRFDELSRSDQLKSLSELWYAMSRLHQAGFAHNDVKLTNAISHDGVVSLIDFELAAPLGSRRLFSGGTRNYFDRSVFQQNISTENDLYAFGVCIAHCLLEVDPATFPFGAGRLVGLLNVAGFKVGAGLVKRLCFPGSAPLTSAAISESCSFLDREVANTQFVEPSNQWRRRKNLAWAKRAAISASTATQAYVRADDSAQTWINEHLNASFLSEGINIGAAGIILGLIGVETSLRCQKFDIDIQRGADWLASRPPMLVCPGLFSGDAGVALTLAIAGKRYLSNRWLKAARSRFITASQFTAETDLFQGCAGILFVGSLIADVTGESWSLGLVDGIAKHLLATARRVDGTVVWCSESPEGDTFFTGAAHGSAGIAMALALWGRRTDCSQSISLSIETFKSLFQLSVRQGSGTFMRQIGKPCEAAYNASWCHGVAGYLWCMLLSFGDDSRLTNEIDWAVAEFARCLPVRNPTYCHGLSGQLELWHMISCVKRFSSMAMAHADRVVDALRLLHVKRDGMCIWSSEDPDVYTPDLWVGFLGPASVLGMHAAGLKEAFLSGNWLRRCSALI